MLNNKTNPSDMVVPSERLIFIALLSSVLVFILDWLIELGVAMAVLYFFVIWIVSKRQKSNELLTTAVICSLLTIIGYFTSPVGGEIWKVISNRIIALMVIWSTSILCYQNIKHVTLAKLQQQIAQEKKTKLQAIIDSATDAVFSFDKDSLVEEWNAGAERVFSYSKTEMIGQPVLNIFPPERQADVDNKIMRIKQGEAVEHLETVHVRKNGSLCDVSLTISPIKNSDGKIIGFLTIGRDISEQKRVEQVERTLKKELEQRVEARTEELAKMNEALEQSNVDLQQFAYIASHDLQAPLRSISGFAQLLQRKYGGFLDSEADEYIAFIVNGVKNMQTLIQDLLTFSKIESESRPFLPTNLNDIYENALIVLAPAIEETAAQITRDELPEVCGDASQLTQLLQNLIGNGIKYHRELSPCVHVSAQKKDKNWEISVKDNGIGFDPHLSEQIFEIFRRLHTKQEYPGTGIGLAVCQRIVQRHQGRIWVETAPSKGSTFFFTIPQFCDSE